jgi:hypothetical protein
MFVHHVHRVCAVQAGYTCLEATLSQHSYLWAPGYYKDCTRRELHTAWLHGRCTQLLDRLAELTAPDGPLEKAQLAPEERFVVLAGKKEEHMAARIMQLRDSMLNVLSRGAGVTAGGV